MKGRLINIYDKDLFKDVHSLICTSENTDWKRVTDNNHIEIDQCSICKSLIQPNQIFYFEGTPDPDGDKEEYEKRLKACMDVDFIGQLQYSDQIYDVVTHKAIELSSKLTPTGRIQVDIIVNSKFVSVYTGKEIIQDEKKAVDL